MLKLIIRTTVLAVIVCGIVPHVFSQTQENCRTVEEVQALLKAKVQQYDSVHYTFRQSSVVRDSVLELTRFIDSESTVTVCDNSLYWEADAVHSDYDGVVHSQGVGLKSQSIKRHGLLVTPHITYTLRPGKAVAVHRVSVQNHRSYFANPILQCFRIPKDFVSTSQTYVLLSDFLNEQPIGSSFTAQCADNGAGSELISIGGIFADARPGHDGRLINGNTNWSVSFNNQAAGLPQQVLVSRATNWGESTHQLKVFSYGKFEKLLYPEVVAGTEAHTASDGTVVTDAAGTVTLAVKAAGDTVIPIDVDRVLAEWGDLPDGFETTASLTARNPANTN